MLILFPAVYGIVCFLTKCRIYLLYEYFKSRFHINLQYQGRYVHKQKHNSWPKINLINENNKFNCIVQFFCSVRNEKSANLKAQI